jgi:hypothetical protein
MRTAYVLSNLNIHASFAIPIDRTVTCGDIVVSLCLNVARPSGCSDGVTLEVEPSEFSRAAVVFGASCVDERPVGRKLQ